MVSVLISIFVANNNIYFLNGNIMEKFFKIEEIVRNDNVGEDLMAMVTGGLSSAGGSCNYTCNSFVCDFNTCDDYDICDAYDVCPFDICAHGECELNICEDFDICFENYDTCTFTC